jgi:parvulin-like peptidyl-prolyl isomerase
MRPSFQAAFKTLEPGQLSEVIREERSVHLLRLDKRWVDPKTNQMMVHYHEIAMRVEPGAEAVRDSRKMVQALIADARKNTLAKAATRAGVATSESQYFREGLSNNDVFKRFPELEAWCFSAKVGSVSHPVPTENGWYIYEILDRQPNGLRPLTQARTYARTRLIHSLQVQHASEAATQARAGLAAGTMSDEQAARQFHGALGIATTVTKNGYLGSLGAEPKVVGALFATPPGTWSQPLTGNWNAVVGYVLERIRPTADDFKQQAPQIREALLNDRRRVLFTEWMQALRKKAKIEDFRENYFEA